MTDKENQELENLILMEYSSKYSLSRWEKIRLKQLESKSKLEKQTKNKK